MDILLPSRGEGLECDALVGISLAQVESVLAFLLVGDA
jgi:hypothetical protein